MTAMPIEIGFGQYIDPRDVSSWHIAILDFANGHDERYTIPVTGKPKSVIRMRDGSVLACAYTNRSLRRKYIEALGLNLSADEHRRRLGMTSESCNGSVPTLKWKRTDQGIISDGAFASYLIQPSGNKVGLKYTMTISQRVVAATPGIFACQDEKQKDLKQVAQEIENTRCIPETATSISK